MSRRQMKDQYVQRSWVGPFLKCFHFGEPECFCVHHAAPQVHENRAPLFGTSPLCISSLGCWFQRVIMLVIQIYQREAIKYFLWMKRAFKITAVAYFVFFSPKTLPYYCPFYWVSRADALILRCNTSPSVHAIVTIPDNELPHASPSVLILYFCRTALLGPLKACPGRIHLWKTKDTPKYLCQSALASSLCSLIHGAFLDTRHEMWCLFIVQGKCWKIKGAMYIHAYDF